MGKEGWCWVPGLGVPLWGLLAPGFAGKLWVDRGSHPGLYYVVSAL